MAWFKYAPFNLKKYSEFNIDNFGTLKVADASIKVDNWRNETFLKRLEDGMTLNDSKKYFKFIHTKGAHLPFDMSEDIVRLGTENKAYTTYYNQVRGTAKLLAEYLQDLKELGVYDDSVIVLLSDHGYSPSNKEPKDRQNPMLMVKGKNEQHDFQRSYDVVSHADLMEAFDRLLDGKQSTELFDYHEGDYRERYYIEFAWKKEDQMTEMKTTGPAWDYEAMEYTGKVYKYETYYEKSRKK